jgi:hypothetical protein
MLCVFEKGRLEDVTTFLCHFPVRPWQAAACKLCIVRFHAVPEAERTLSPRNENSVSSAGTLRGRFYRAGERVRAALSPSCMRPGPGEVEAS